MTTRIELLAEYESHLNAVARFAAEELAVRDDTLVDKIVADPRFRLTTAGLVFTDGNMTVTISDPDELRDAVEWLSLPRPDWRAALKALTAARLRAADQQDDAAEAVRQAQQAGFERPRPRR